MSKTIAIFASGSGSNAENIAHFLKNTNNIDVSLIVCDNPNAYVLKRAKKLNIPSLIITKKELNDPNNLLKTLKEHQIEHIVLAGFLSLIPKQLINKFPKRIINIHPALLPKYGGKGMYGHRVHEAVVKNKELETGITIHYVNERYDEGQIIFQAKCDVKPNDTANDIADKIHELEMKHFPTVIEKWILTPKNRL